MPRFAESAAAICPETHCTDTVQLPISAHYNGGEVIVRVDSGPLLKHIRDAHVPAVVIKPPQEMETAQ